MGAKAPTLRYWCVIPLLASLAIAAAPAHAAAVARIIALGYDASRLTVSR